MDKSNHWLRIKTVTILLISTLVVLAPLMTWGIYHKSPGENYVQASSLDDFNKSWRMTGYSLSSFSYTARLYNQDYKHFPPDKYNVDSFHALVGSINNDAEAKLAIRYWLNLIKQNPYLLAGDAKVILDKDINATTLSTNDGLYAADAAINLANELWAKLSNAKSITYSTAPKGSYELTLINDQLYISDRFWLLWSDLESVKIILDDDRVIWVLGGGGDIVVRDYIYNMPTYNT
jgi:hypothetical protein